jgi:carboxymethylenebutenolidase
MHGNFQNRMVEFPVPGGGKASAYEARPACAGSYPGVVVVQEWWGLNDHIKDIAGRLAHEGFVALAPDLYRGRVTQDPAQAGAWMRELDRDEALSILLGAISFLQENEPIFAEKPGSEHIGVIGFCMGGTFALQLPCRTQAIRVAVPFYGDLPDPIEQIRDIQCPVLFFAAGKDRWINAEKVERLREAFATYGVNGEVRVYPDAEHAFFNDTRPEVYNSAAAQDAWMRTIALLNRTLKS